jgi:hypothetical protein
VPVGCFRIDTRESQDFDAPGRALIAKWFPQPDSVLLVIHPYRVGICLAAFFYWNGDALPDFPDFEIALIQHAPGCSPPEQVPEPAITAAEPVAPPLIRTARTTSRVTAAVVAGAMAAFAAVAFWLRPHQISQEAAPAAVVGRPAGDVVSQVPAVETQLGLSPVPEILLKTPKPLDSAPRPQPRASEVAAPAVKPFQLVGNFSDSPQAAPEQLAAPPAIALPPPANRALPPGFPV